MAVVLAWYFAAEDNRLRYGDRREIVVGETHSIEGTPVLCEHGLHGSIDVLDALAYAPGTMLYRVELSGDMDIGNDKIAAQHRTYLWGLAAEEVLREFARKCALDVLHLWDAPAVVREYLETGKKELREEARVVARAARVARDAAKAARDAVGYYAAWAEGHAEGDAAWAARHAARDAAWYAAGDAAWYAARDAAWYAAINNLAKHSTRHAPRQAAWSAALAKIHATSKAIMSDPDCVSIRNHMKKSQSKKLVAMLEAAANTPTQ